MNKVDIAEMMGQGTFDLLVFCYDGNAAGDDPTGRVFLLPKTNAVTSVAQMSDMEEAGFQINGAIQLAFDQMAFCDPTIVGASRFLVTDGNGNWGWLHEVEVWKADNYLKPTEEVADGRDFTPPYEP